LPVIAVELGEFLGHFVADVQVAGRNGPAGTGLSTASHLHPDGSGPRIAVGEQIRADAIAAIYLCVVPTQTFECLFAFVVLGHRRRQLLWFAVTRHPTAEWLAQQIVEAFPWNAAPAYLVRDNDGAYGQAFRRRVRTMGIRDRPTSTRSPWQNSYSERLIGTLRRDCLDHVLIFGARHLRRILTEYSPYYNESRTHLSLDKDAPLRRAVQRCGPIVAAPILSGLHHRYARIRFSGRTGVEARGSRLPTQPATEKVRSMRTRSTCKYLSSEQVSTDSRVPVSRFEFAVGTADAGGRQAV
jgi:hypothetical protein